MMVLPSLGPAATVSVALDRWMYPFAFTGGTRDLAPTFGAIGSPGFDNRDGQFVIGFDTAGQIPTGLGPGTYQIISATVRAMVGSPSGFEYDPTYDTYRTYLAPENPNSLADSDIGRPIELHGLGFRNGYTHLSFGPTDKYTIGARKSPPSSAAARNRTGLG
jgi:hypothetical protein